MREKVNLGPGPGIKDIKERGMRQKSGKMSCVWDGIIRNIRCLGRNNQEYNPRVRVRGMKKMFGRTLVL